MEFELVFKAQTSAARAATSDLRKEVGALGTEANQGAEAFSRHAASMTRDATAAGSLSREAENARKTLASISVAAGSVANTLSAPVANMDRNNVAKKAAADGTVAKPSVVPANSNSAATNAMFQFQDIAMTSAMGMNPLMVGLQQGSQLAGGFAGMSIKEAGAAALGGITGLLNPVSLVTVGLTAATAAAIQFFTTSSSEGKTASEVIEAQASLVKELAAAWGVATNEAKTYTDAQKIIAQTNASAGLVETQKQQQKAFDTLNAKFFEFGVGKQYNAIPGFAEQFGKAFSDLEDSIKNGSADVDGFVESIKRIDDANPGFSKVGNEFIKLAEDLYKLNGEAKKTVDIMAQIALQGSRLDPLGVFDAGKQQQRLADLTPSKTELQAQQIDAYRLTTDAKSPQEKAAAARATAAAQFNPSESSTDRANRIELAGQQALISAEKQLAEAKRDRVRSIDDTLTSARLELGLIGQTTSSIETQRMELRLLTEAKTAADKAGTTVSGEEITRIKQAAAEYGRLQEAIKGTNILRNQTDNIQQLRLEIALVGQSAAVRARALALAQAEKRIRDEGITANGQLAQTMRENAQIEADQTTQLNRLQDAWNTVQSTGESAIDAIGEAIRTGDWVGAANSVIADIQKSIIELGLTNPLKNALLGTNYGTLSDAGGVIGQLMGGAAVSPVTPSSISAMNVTAASVVINGAMQGGGLINDLTKSLTSGVANDNMQAVYRQAIKNIESSGGNYGALGPVTASGDRAYGAYQVMGSNIPSWTKNALGKAMTPSQFLGSPSAQDAVFDKYFGGYVNKYGPSGAAQAWFGGPGSVGGSGQGRDMLGTSGNEYVNRFNADVSKMSSSFKIADGSSEALGRSMSGASDATGRLGSGLGAATNGLSQFGNGVAQMGSQLGNILSNGGAGTGNNWWQDILGSIGKSLGGVSPTSPLWAANTTLGSFLARGFDVGGFTGNIDEKSIAGYVHGGEFVFSKLAVDKIGLGPLDAMHRQARAGYASGGYVASVANSNVPAAPMWPSVGQTAVASASPVINIINGNGSNVKVRDRSTSNGVAIDVMIDEAVAEKVSKVGSNTGRAIQSQFGLNRGLSRR
ncbi:hypothetical protein ABID16_000090 [Rhizobium aquaticum]|uniref:Bacteriophage tail tape measure N-terminal domain-containing protein n=1 Tax=Rhizobium aquaticum TaxID=1549636 RepID=A0ABV2ITH0_9HYPH